MPVRAGVQSGDFELFSNLELLCPKAEYMGSYCMDELTLQR